MSDRGHLARPDPGELVVVSQRGPFSFVLNSADEPVARPAPGGLATLIRAMARRRRFTWIASAVGDADRAAAAGGRTWSHDLARVELVQLPWTATQSCYEGFANPTLWFLQHGLTDRLCPGRLAPIIWRAWDEGYRQTNRCMAAAASRQRGATFLVEDYHLYLVPAFLRPLQPAAPIAHFSHIPWPEPCAWDVLPAPLVAELLEGMLSADLLGFQSTLDATRFTETCRRFVRGIEVSAEVIVQRSGWRTRLGSYPVTIDPAALMHSAQMEPRIGLRRLPDPPSDVQVIQRIDRLDPSKNIVAGFQAFELLLQRRPDLRGRVLFRAHLIPTRTELPEYAAARDEALMAAARVNEHFGRDSWTPVRILLDDDRELATTELRRFDVLLVNSLADGMNLVAKEGVLLNQRDGVLVLSEGAGAFQELGRWALGIRPEDVRGTADALEMALGMAAGERRARLHRLRRAVLSRTTDDWLDEQLQDLRRAVDWRPSSAGPRVVEEIDLEPLGEAV